MFHGVVWQLTYARIFNNGFAANLPKNLPAKSLVNRLKFDQIMAMSVGVSFFAHPVCQCLAVIS